MLKLEFLICLLVLKDLLTKCHSVRKYLQKEDFDIVTALQAVDTTIKTLQRMRNEAVFKKFYDEAVQLAEDLDMEVIEPHARKLADIWMKIITLSTEYLEMRKNSV